MSLRVNLSPSGRQARRLIRAALAMSCISAFLGLALMVSTVRLEEHAAQSGEAAHGDKQVVQESVPPEIQQLVGQLASLDMGKGHGLANALAELEVVLPQQLQVRRVQYAIADGTIHLDVEAREAQVLSGAVVELEKRFDQVRILERQETRIGREEGVSMRLSLRERAPS